MQEYLNYNPRRVLRNNFLRAISENHLVTSRAIIARLHLAIVSLERYNIWAAGSSIMVTHRAGGAVLGVRFSPPRPLINPQENYLKYCPGLIELEYGI